MGLLLFFIVVPPPPCLNSLKYALGGSVIESKHYTSSNQLLHLTSSVKDDWNANRKSDLHFTFYKPPSNYPQQDKSTIDVLSFQKSSLHSHKRTLRWSQTWRCLRCRARSRRSPSVAAVWRCRSLPPRERSSGDFLDSRSVQLTGFLDQASPRTKVRFGWRRHEGM